LAEIRKKRALKEGKRKKVTKARNFATTPHFCRNRESELSPPKPRTLPPPHNGWTSNERQESSAVRLGPVFN